IDIRVMKNINISLLKYNLAQKLSDHVTIQSWEDLNRSLVEAMKMEHQVKAIEDGKVTQVLIKKDDQLENGALLMIVD
ncbi:MAG: acetyl-CoA carboxylase biotin carboxyl carrier protein subunit, partial [SAR86 cluster bacterium]|nr:acetyl-CoA carboxylase biotin carboxyl carrier protein subunit [SAR86 cluster bacterium]